MSITQTVDIPDNHRLIIDVPREVPAGRTVLTFTPAAASMFQPIKIDDVRQLLQKEMTEKGTLAVTAAAGDGWESHVREHYAES